MDELDSKIDSILNNSYDDNLDEWEIYKDDYNINLDTTNDIIDSILSQIVNKKMFNGGNDKTLNIFNKYNYLKKKHII